MCGSVSGITATNGMDYAQPRVQFHASFRAPESGIHRFHYNQLFQLVSAPTYSSVISTNTSRLGAYNLTHTIQGQVDWHSCDIAIAVQIVCKEHAPRRSVFKLPIIFNLRWGKL